MWKQTAGKLGVVLCDNCECILEFLVPQPKCPVLLTPYQPKAFCKETWPEDLTCEEHFEAKGGNAKRIEDIIDGRIVPSESDEGTNG